MAAPYAKPDRVVENDEFATMKSPDYSLPEASMENQLQELDDQVKTLMNVVRELEAKLEPVMIIEDEETSDESPVMPGRMTPTALRVAASRMAVLRANRRIVSIYDRVDV